MAITTIQLDENVKRELERMKESSSDTYEEVILTLIKTSEEIKRDQRELLIEECKEMASDSLKITKEWETTDATLNWKW